MQLFQQHKGLLHGYADGQADASFTPFARCGLAFWSAARLWRAGWSDNMNAQSQWLGLQLWCAVLGYEPDGVPAGLWDVERHASYFTGRVRLNWMPPG